MIKSYCIPIYLLIIQLLIFFCGPIPSNPYKNPDNATIEVLTIDGVEPVEPISVNAGKEVAVDIHLTLSTFIEEIVVEISSKDSLPDTLINIGGNWDSVYTTITVPITFSSVGIKKCIITAHRINGTVISDTLIFTVSVPDIICPEWNTDTIDAGSVKGSRGSYVISSQFSGGNDAPAVFSLDTGEQALPFYLTADTLCADFAADTGSYLFTVTATSGECRSVAAVLWTVSLAGHYSLHSDVITINENGTVAIFPLENDTIDTTMHLTEVLGASNGTVELRGDTVFYTASDGVTGTDTVLYFVNSTDDTGKIIVIIEEQHFFINDDTVSVTVRVCGK